jgi:LCP family protein required for cell wall assembly
VSSDESESNLLPSAGRWSAVARRVRTRRAVMLVVASVVLPGSAQLLAGNKTVGRAALRVWALLLVGLPFGIWWSGRSGLVSLALHPQALATIQVSLVVLGLGWGALLVDAWRLGRPDRQSVGTRVLSTGMVLCLLAGVGTPVAYGVTLAGAQRDLVTSIFQPGGVGQLYKGRLNIAILGGEPVREGSHSPKDSVVSYTDQNAVASVDLSTGQTTLISIPRNMQYAQFPPETPMGKQFPNGFPDFFYGIYPYGAQHPAMFPGSSNPGATAVEQAMAQLLGIPIHYYVILNIAGFESLVDSVGGLTIRVTERLPIGGGHHAGACDQQGGGCQQLAHNKILGWINPGLQHMDGYTALWYARSREGTSDYDRMLRERCVLNGMLKEMDPLTVLTHFRSLVTSAKYAIKTDLTTGALSALVKVAPKTKKSDVTSVLMNPPLIAAVAPDVAVARNSVQGAITASSAPPTFAAASTKPGAKPKKKPTAHDAAHPAAAVGGSPVPLSQVCSYS